MDAALRPEGKAGALVRTIDSYVAYHTKWAKTWEFQALLKIRPAAGDLALGARYVDAVSDFVWSAAARENFVDDVRPCAGGWRSTFRRSKRPARSTRPRRIARDVEFAVQILVVHGRSDVTLRSLTTLTALEALATWGYVGRRTRPGWVGLSVPAHPGAPRQVRQMRRTHLLPDRDAELRVIARSMGIRTETRPGTRERFRQTGAPRQTPAREALLPSLLHAVARLDSGEARLTPRRRTTTVGARLPRPKGALRHLESLTNGVSRRAAIQRTLPVMLGWFADCPDPDSGLAGFRRVSEALGSTPWYLRLLRDESQTAEQHGSSAGRHRSPRICCCEPGCGADAGRRRTVAAPTGRRYRRQALTAGLRQADPESAIAAIRAAVARFPHLGGRLSGPSVHRRGGPGAVAHRGCDDPGGSGCRRRSCVSTKAGRTWSSSSSSAWADAARNSDTDPDADVMFVYRGREASMTGAASDAALGVTGEPPARAASADPPIDMDADLRPEDATARWLVRWRPYQALPAVVGVLGGASAPACAAGRGSPALQDAFIEVIDPIRYPGAVSRRRTSWRCGG